MMLKEIGFECSFTRKRAGLKQKDVADELGYSPQTISAFECGKINNLFILLWYIDHGLNTDVLRGLAHRGANTYKRGSVD